ncbi:MAG TPA: UDP-N-acetylmuramate--L-alanine ligase [Candidatus Megaira endosymbiont of Nemacystus decipiens]|nr:UDP-N-acetylmuramate--L-alanine ligase [Candidatus Megaera endosymbiont of Nemacystus decipiens]
MILLETKRKNKTLDTIHFVGIGGIGISGIAEIMFNLGYKVQGSDVSESANTKRLVDKGIRVIIGHNSANVSNVSYVVLSSAISEDNPEVLAAIDQSIPVITRSQMLGELMRLKFSVAVSGSHGKTTTTSLIACLFEAAGLDPTVISGGLMNGKKTNAYLGSSDYLIVEADESDATFIKIPSTVGIITNIDPEHMDYYKDFNALTNAFESFLSNLPFYGFGVACIDHPVVRSLVSKVKDRKIITYGIESLDANIVAHNIVLNSDSSVFDLKIKFAGRSGESMIQGIVLPLSGLHNVLNALAAIAIGVELDFGIKIIKDGFLKYQGVSRRFTNIGSYKGITFIDDYAHHPVEIKATLMAARSIVESRGSRVIAIFQPHKYTRLQNLFDEFTNCFSHAHEIYITSVFAAGENKIESYDSENLCSALQNIHSHASYITGEDNISNMIKLNAKDKDIIIFMGAGDITHTARSVLCKLERESCS